MKGNGSFNPYGSEGPSNQTCRWAVSVKPTAVSSSCQSPACRGHIQKGALRACRAAAVSQRWYHIECAEGGLGPIDTVAGLDSLYAEQQEQVKCYCDDETRGRRRADYVEHVAQSKRHRPNRTLNDPPEIAESHDGSENLNNLGLWNSAQWGDLERWVPTIASVPSSTHHAVARLKRVVLLERKEAKDQSDEPRCERAWKIITFLDRLLFALRRQRGEETNAAQVTRRIWEAWRGNWQGLWKEARVSFGQRGGAGAKLAADARAINAYVADGLLSKAVGRARGASSFKTGPDT